MISFASDYIEGAHPRLLEALWRTNLEQLPGYGTDLYCERAKERIRKECESPDASIWFIPGGTQTNQLTISTMLDRTEAVIAAETGHVSVHEAGAIEFTGHKVITLGSKDGKLAARDIADYASRFFADENHEHMPYPGMVYVSHPTEYGTLYTETELTAIRRVCDEFGLRLYLDGARLAYGLVRGDLTLPKIAALCDAFYIGGTKCGALIGEALVFPRGNAPSRFVTRVKQHGALLAKGRVMGIQFDELFTDGLYYEIGRHAVGLADRIRAALGEMGIPQCVPSPTNQIFIALDDGSLGLLGERVAYSFWERRGDETVIRLATDWATTQSSVEELIALLGEITSFRQ